MRIGILTVSDRASRGEYEDKGGPAIVEFLREVLSCEWEPRIARHPRRARAHRVCAEGDVRRRGMLPGRHHRRHRAGEARRDARGDRSRVRKLLPGFGELMREVSLKSVPTAILSRQTAGIRGKSLIINLPGKPAAIRECLLAVMPAVPYCIDLIGGPYLTTHEARGEGVPAEE